MDLGVTQCRQWRMSTGLLGGFLEMLPWFWRVPMPVFVSLLPPSRYGTWNSSSHLAALGKPSWSNASALRLTEPGGQEKLRALVALQSHQLNQTQGVLPGPLLCEMIHFLYCSKMISLDFSVTCSRSTVTNNNGNSQRFLPSQWGKQMVRAEHSRYITLSYNVISAPGVAQSRFRKAGREQMASFESPRGSRRKPGRRQPRQWLPPWRSAGAWSLAQPALILFAHKLGPLHSTSRSFSFSHL